MTAFPLTIVTPEGLIYEGEAQELTVCTTTGHMGILACHIPIIAPVVAGRCVVMADGKKRAAQCAEGMARVKNGQVFLLCTSFAWEAESRNI